MIAVLAHSEGSVLPVRAQAGARRSGIVGEHDGALKIAVTAAPEKGKANKALVALLSRALHVRKSSVQLIAGQASGSKRFLIRGIAPDELHRRLAAARGAP